MKQVILIAFFLSGRFVSAQLINGGFENWDSTYTSPYDPLLNSLFGVPNPKSGYVDRWKPSNGWGSSQTTDSYSGNYALVLHNWYNYARSWVNYREPISTRPAYLQGYFKYLTGGVNGHSHGKAIVTLTRFNGTLNDTVAKGSFRFDSTVSFTPFQISLNYISAANPDSIHVYIANSDTNVFWNVVCHLLYLDNLSLTDTPLGIENLRLNEKNLAIYPNPAAGELIIQNNSAVPLQFHLYNALGETVMSRLLTQVTNSINLSDCVGGIYFYKLGQDDATVKSGKIIKQ